MRFSGPGGTAYFPATLTFFVRVFGWVMTPILLATKFLNPAAAEMPLWVACLPLGLVAALRIIVVFAIVHVAGGMRQLLRNGISVECRRCERMIHIPANDFNTKCPYCSERDAE